MKIKSKAKQIEPIIKIIDGEAIQLNQCDFGVEIDIDLTTDDEQIFEFASLKRVDCEFILMNEANTTTIQHFIVENCVYTQMKGGHGKAKLIAWEV
jgi:hypothetical protein